MKPVLPLLLISSLLTSSCSGLYSSSRRPASLGLDGNCIQNAAPLLAHDYVPTEAEAVLQELLESSALSKNLAEKYRYLIREAQVDLSEAGLVSEYILQLPTDEKRAERLFSYLQFARSRPAEREKILKELPIVLSSQYESSNNHWVKGFRKNQRKIDLYIQKREKVHYHQMSKVTQDEGRARYSAWKAAYEEGKIYRSLSLKCSNKSVSTTTPEEAKLLTRAFTVGSIGSAVTTYSFINWDKEKDGRWYGELGWTLFWASLFGFINGKYVFSNPKLSPWKGRLPLTFAVVSTEDALISAIYSPTFSFLFGDGAPERLEKLQSFMDSEEGQKMIAELYQIIQEEGLDKKYEAEMKLLFSKEDGSLMSTNEIYELDPTTLDIEAGQDMLLEAIAELDYRQSAGPLSVGGSPAKDRYAFHRMLDVAYVPINIQLGLFMNHFICMSPNPKVGMLKAVSTFMAGKMMMDAFYFWSRRHAIGQ